MRRKKYKPKPVNALAAFNALNRHKPMTTEQTTDLGIAYWTALDIHLRDPSVAQWGILASCVNTAIQLANRGYGAEFHDTLNRASYALNRCKDRAAQGKSYALDADGIAAIREALQVHDAQCSSAKVIEVRDALRDVYRVAA